MMTADDTALYTHELPALRASLARFVRRRLDGSQDADELTDSVLARVWESYATRAMPQPFPRTPAELKGLVFQTARRLTMNYYRAAPPRTVSVDDAGSSVMRKAAAVPPDIDTALAVRRAVDALPPEERAAIVAVHFEGATRDEHASECGVTPRTVDRRLRSARATLRAVLA